MIYNMIMERKRVIDCRLDRCNINFIPRAMRNKKFSRLNFLISLFDLFIFSLIFGTTFSNQEYLHTLHAIIINFLKLVELFNSEFSLSFCGIMH
jgi:hypothetical protein